MYELDTGEAEVEGWMWFQMWGLSRERDPRVDESCVNCRDSSGDVAGDG
jgi:hypothetical protein